MDIHSVASYLLESEESKTKEYKVKDAKFVFEIEDEDYGNLSYKTKDSYGHYKIYFDNGGAYGFTAPIEKEMLEKLYTIATSKEANVNKIRGLLEIGKGAQLKESRIEEFGEEDIKFFKSINAKKVGENYEKSVRELTISFHFDYYKNHYILVTIKSKIDDKLTKMFTDYSGHIKLENIEPLIELIETTIDKLKDVKSEFNIEANKLLK